MIHLSTKLKQNVLITFRFLQFLKTTVLIMLLLITYYKYFFSSQQALFLLFFFLQRDGGFVPSKQSHNPFIDLRPFGKLMLVLLLCNQLGRLGDRHLWYVTPTFFAAELTNKLGLTFKSCLGTQKFGLVYVAFLYMKSPMKMQNN